MAAALAAAAAAEKECYCLVSSESIEVEAVMVTTTSLKAPTSPGPPLGRARMEGLLRMLRSTQARVYRDRSYEISTPATLATPCRMHDSREAEPNPPESSPAVRASSTRTTLPRSGTAGSAFSARRL